MQNTSGDHGSASGAFLTTGAFLIWGLSPIYFKRLQTIPALEILLHRMVWSFLFLLPIVMATRCWPELRAALLDRRKLLPLVGTTVLVAANWFVFIWAVNNDHILEASLGYYINPLINVVLGTVFLKERLRRAQKLAVALTAIGVVYLSVQIGYLPWISLFLALSFAFYALIRKVAPVNALVGLTVETLLLCLPAAAYLVIIGIKGSGAFLRISPLTDVLLICAALVTAPPLLLFTAGARKIHLSTVGILQYLAPSCNFLLALWVYQEPILEAQIFTFFLIWTALAIYTVDSMRHYRHHGRPQALHRADCQTRSALRPTADRDRR